MSLFVAADPDLAVGMPEAAGSTIGCVDPAMVVAHARSYIPCPADPVERDRMDQIAHHLARCDGEPVADLLTQPVDRVGSAYPQLAAYALVVLTDEGLLATGLSMNGRDRLLRTIRHQVRFEIVRLPAGSGSLWLMPTDTDAVTAVHVAALVLTRSGRTARPWLWPGIPESGHFLVLGPHAEEHPFARHRRCVMAEPFSRMVMLLPSAD